MNNNSDNTIKPPFAAMLFYPLAILYFELMLKGMGEYDSFFDFSLLTIVLFSLAAGFLLAFLFALIRPVILSRILSGITLLVLWLAFTAEYDCSMFYKMYYSIIYALTVTGNIMGDFSSVVWDVAGEYWLQEIIMFIPVIVYLFLCRRILPDQKIKGKFLIGLAVPFIVLQLAASFAGRFGPAGNLYTNDFTFYNAVPEFGLINSFRLEFTYMLFGTPEADLSKENYTAWAEPHGDNLSDAYSYNKTVDFASLIDNESDETVKKMHEYFGSLEPTKQNEYTGYFKGKNLIFISAEAFCPYAVDEEFTPTLYKLANNGFVFEDFYQPSWSLSTTGGEFANLTGVIPEWIETDNSFTVSADNYMPYSPAGLFSREGYVCRAYHNNSYDYYERNKTHPNLGYDYKGIGNGLTLEHQTWPYSDLEMMEATADEMIAGYKRDHIPFHTYYMTVSGHCNYNWANAMAEKHKDEAMKAFPDASPSVQAYMACNKELDLAMEYLLGKLEEAGIADDTVIVLGADHYPFALSDGAKEDYYVELSGTEDTIKSVSRYKNTLILYCSSMKEPVYVETPCSSIDITPTIANLFGMEYDSRLYSGRDIMAVNYTHGEVSSAIPLVIIPVGSRYSFVTDAGVYDAVTKEFRANTEIEDEEQYIKDVQKMISNKWTYARLIILKDYYSRVFPGGVTNHSASVPYRRAG